MERIEALVPQEVVASRVRGPGCGAYLLAELAELCVRARRCEAGYPSLHPERPNKGARAFSVTSAVGSLVGSAVGSVARARVCAGSPLTGCGKRFTERTNKPGVMAGRTPATCDASGETLTQNLPSSLPVNR